ncbi:MAG: membrane protein insertase YidC [Bacteroidales bacterium]
MDKNTIVGMLLMGAVIFGFMWMNQPSAEELEAQRKAKELARTEAAAARTSTITISETSTADTLSKTDIIILKSTVEEFGTTTYNNDGSKSYNITNGDVNITLYKGDLSGTVTLADDKGSVTVADALNPTTKNDLIAATILKNMLRTIGKYENFAPFVNGKEQIINLENQFIKLELSTKGGVIETATLKEYDSFQEDQLVLFDGKDNDYSFILNSNSQRFDTKDLYFEATQVNDSTVLMALNMVNGSKFGIQYTLPSDSYMVKMEVVQMDMNRTIPTNITSMDFTWHQKMARHEKGEMFEERNSAIYYKYAGGDVEDLSASSDDTENVMDKIKWIGFKNQFFSAVLIAENNFTYGKFNSKIIEKGAADHSKYLKDMTATASVEYNSTESYPATFYFYLGPNKYHLLDTEGERVSPDEDLELTNLIPLGWSLFRWVNTLIVIPVFDILGNWISNYGVIILILTLFIKLILFPLTYKSTISQVKMRFLAPDIQAINDKYPGQENAMIRQQKTMALYSQAGASPFSGCLPLLLQMPILIAMFAFFPSCIELRGESFLWAKDLSAPDAIVTWTTHIPFVSDYFGNHLSLFCILMTVTNILYTRINMQSQASNNQMPGMKMMMYMMPVMFLVFFNNYAAGLSYYYFISLLISIIQTYVTRYYVSEDKMRAKMAENAKKPKKKSGFMARLEEAQRQQQAAVREQQKKGGKR